jgi:ferredoxin
LKKGYVELDPFVAEVNLNKCQGTGACVEACIVEGALSMVETDVDGESVQTGTGEPGPLHRLRRLRGGLSRERHQRQRMDLKAV